MDCRQRASCLQSGGRSLSSDVIKVVTDVCVRTTRFLDYSFSLQSQMFVSTSGNQDVYVIGESTFMSPMNIDNMNNVYVTQNLSSTFICCIWISIMTDKIQMFVNIKVINVYIKHNQDVY